MTCTEKLLKVFEFLPPDEERTSDQAEIARIVSEVIAMKAIRG